MSISHDALSALCISWSADSGYWTPGSWHVLRGSLGAPSAPLDEHMPQLKHRCPAFGAVEGFWTPLEVGEGRKDLPDVDE